MNKYDINDCKFSFYRIFQTMRQTVIFLSFAPVFIDIGKEFV